MMNNPAIAYGFGNPMAQSQMSPAPPAQHAQNSFPPAAFSNQYQRPSPGYQQQQPAPPNPYQQPAQLNHAFSRPESRGNPSLAQGFTPQPSPVTNSQGGPFGSRPASSQPQFTPPTSAPQRHPSTPTSASTTGNMAQSQSTPNANLAQQAQIQNAAQATRALPQASTASSPQSAARERARVSVLLEINTHLLQEVVSLQAQGKAGSAPNPAQQSPSSPTSTDPSNPLSNSPVDPSKPAAGKPASQEYADCMRRLQANLSYLAAIADAKKKANGALPPGPAIMIAPPHLTDVHVLYKKLNTLFPEASQSTINKAMAYATAQAAKPNTNPPGQG